MPEPSRRWRSRRAAATSAGGRGVTACVFLPGFLFRRRRFLAGPRRVPFAGLSPGAAFAAGAASGRRQRKWRCRRAARRSPPCSRWSRIALSFRFGITRRAGLAAPVHPGHSAEAGRALADTLGNCNAALAPGAVVVAENAPPLLADAVHFEENTQALRAAASLGIVRPLADAFNSRFDRSAHVAKLWGYCVGRASRRHASKFPERRKRNWSGRRESNPRRKLGKLLLCH